MHVFGHDDPCPEFEMVVCTRLIDEFNKLTAKSLISEQL
jgi:hypothetical protein